MNGRNNSGGFEFSLSALSINYFYFLFVINYSLEKRGLSEWVIIISVRRHEKCLGV